MWELFTSGSNLFQLKSPIASHGSPSKPDVDQESAVWLSVLEIDVPKQRHASTCSWTSAEWAWDGTLRVELMACAQTVNPGELVPGLASELRSFAEQV